MSGSLPIALSELGVGVTTVTPLHRAVPRADLVAGKRYSSQGFLVTPMTIDRLVFLDIPELFDRDTIYSDAVDEYQRYAVYQHAALDYIRLRGIRPDVIHCNDWQTGLVPAFVRGPYRADPIVGDVPTVFTIHNLGYQGIFSAAHLGDLGMEAHSELVHGSVADDYISFMQTALANTDLITTVSPTYAREIQTPAGGAGLDELLRFRRDSVVGILNGIDTDVWSPSSDPLIPFRYSARSLWRKEWNKRELLAEAGLPYQKNVPVVGVVTRLAWQKGIEIMRGPLLHFLNDWDMRFVLLGSGDVKYEEFFTWLAGEYPHQVSFHRGYSEKLSHRIEAGSDIFLMPSLYEPCGLNQMYSLAYGTAPIVRNTGGLADTVEHVEDATGTGFVFEHYTEDALGWAMGQALALHTDRGRWQAMQRRQMAVDNSWAKRATEYLDRYRALTPGPPGGGSGG